MSIFLPFQGQQGYGYALLIIYIVIVALVFNCWFNWDDYKPVFVEKCLRRKKSENNQAGEENFDNVA